MAPSISISCANVSWVSPVPGGISTIIKSRLFQLTFWAKVLIVLVTIGPLQIIGVCSSVRKPIDIHWMSYLRIGFKFEPSLSGFWLIEKSFGNDGP